MNKKVIYFIVLIFILLFYSFTVQAAVVHRVSHGEDLYTISLQYGVTVKEIIRKNNLHKPDNIFDDQILIIPETENSWSYRVKKGDTLYIIAQKLGVSQARLTKFNGLVNTDELYVRQVLYIPPRLRRYKIQPGDSLHKISQMYGVSIEQIIDTNKNIDQNNLEIGKTLKIPYPKTSSPKYQGPNYKKLFPDTFYLTGMAKGNKIALTFDDGPDSIFTPQILDILKEYNVPATFFLIGDRVTENHSVVKRMVNEGHTIGNHTWSHADLTAVDKNRFLEEVNKTEKILSKTAGQVTSLFRLPYGAVSKKVLSQLKNMDYKVIHWSVDSRDWIDMDFNKILINTLPAVRNNSILLLHSAGGENHDLSATVKVLPDIIKTLRMNGYTFTKLEDLLELKVNNP